MSQREADVAARKIVSDAASAAAPAASRVNPQVSEIGRICRMTSLHHFLPVLLLSLFCCIAALGMAANLFRSSYTFSSHELLIVL